MRIRTVALALLLGGVAHAQRPSPSPRSAGLTATFLGNEAWHITDGEYTVITDFPYQSGYSGYMTWDWSAVPKVADPRKLLLVITHEHRDHFAAELVTRVGAATVIGPAKVRAAAGLEGIAATAEARFGPIRVHALPTPHARLEHYSYILDWQGIRIYVPGDTEEPASLLGASNLDVAFVTPWMLRSIERARATIDARKVIVVHHGATERVSAYQGAVVPRQGAMVQLQSPSTGPGETNVSGRPSARSAVSGAPPL